MTIAVPLGSPQSNSLAKDANRPASELRREQLLELAARIIIEEGVDALRPTRLAELAGCTRPLIYQYFPRREDILITLVENFYRGLDERYDIEWQRKLIPCAAEGEVVAVRAFIDDLWERLDDQGLACLLLRTTPNISVSFRSFVKTACRSLERRWHAGFATLGVDEEQAEVLLEAIAVILSRLGEQLREGRIDREAATARLVSAANALVRSGLPSVH